MKKLLCFLFGHRWFLDDTAGVCHKDDFECLRCGKRVKAFIGGRYRTDITEWVEMSGAWKEYGQ